MKVSRSWLKQLVDLKVSDDELLRLLPLRTIGTKEVTPEFIELDMKGYNRADLLSMRGVAYEVAAITGSQVKFSESDPANFVWEKADLPTVSVKVEDEKLAPVYCLAKIEGLRVGPSDQKWVQKLLNSGMRSVNNVADVTNLVMLEYGQPLHAFDVSTVKDETIIVRTARQGEILETLDQKKRQLEESDLLITDPEKALGLAGVMGGKNSEITDGTTTILLEAAIFDPANLRKTSTRLGLQSEASKRFYHGLTKKRLLQALDGAIRMYQELGGKLTALSMVGDLEDQTKKVPLTLEKTQNLIGVEITAEKVEEYLKKLNFSVIRAPFGKLANEVTPESTVDSGVTNAPQNDNVGWVSTPPYYRLDIEIEEDLIEEVARMYGYENIPAKELEGELPEKIDQSLFDLIYSLKTALVEQGGTEIQTYSYYSTQILNNLKYDKAEMVKIANPISSETEYMRNHLWPNLVETVAKNIRQGFEQITIFEIGKIYWPQEGKQPLEEYHLALALLNDSDNPISELNQILQSALKSLDLKVSVGDKIGESADRFHPVRYVYLTHLGQPIGKIGEVHPRIANRFGIEKKVAIAELKLQNLLS